MAERSARRAIEFKSLRKIIFSHVLIASESFYRISRRFLRVGSQASPTVILNTLIVVQVLTHNVFAGRAFNDDFFRLPYVTRHEEINANQNESFTLKKNDSVEKEIASNQAHTFQLSTSANQYLQVVVEQLGIDLTVSLLGPDRQLLAEMDGPYGARGPESVSVITEAAGDYKVKVYAREEPGAVGRYKLTVHDLRDPLPADTSRINGERAYMQGRELSGQKKRKEAIEKYKEAQSQWQAAGDSYNEAKALYRIAVMYGPDKQNAVEYCERALSIQRAIGDRRGEAYTLNWLGLVYGMAGHLSTSLEYSKKALPLWKSENDLINEINTINNIATAYGFLGEPFESLAYHNRALEVRRSIGRRSDIAQTLNNIGVVYDTIGESQKALDYYDQALKLLTAVQNRNKEERKVEGTTLNNIGYTHNLLGDYQTALYYLDQALPIRREINDTLGEGATLTNMGDAYLRLGDPNKALGYYKDALEKHFDRKNDWGRASTHMGMGYAYASLGESQKALENYDEALKLQRKIEDRQGEAAVLDKVGRLYAALGNAQEAKNNFQKALLLWRSVKDDYGESATLYGIARAERDGGNLAGAKANIDEALKKAESFRTRVVSQQLRAYYIASVRDYYDLAIDVLMQLHQKDPSKRYLAEALELSERSRARSLLELLHDARFNIREGVDAELLKREREQLQRLDAKAAVQIDMLRRKPTEEQKQAIATDIKELLTQYRDLQVKIKTGSPRYAALTQPEPLRLAEIQKLLDPSTLMLEYSLGNERSYLWTVTASSINGYQLPGRKELEAQAKLVYNLLTAPQSVRGINPAQELERVEQAKAQYPQEAARLSEILLGPVATQLSAKRLLIAAEGALQYVPFYALPVPSRLGGRAIINSRAVEDKTSGFLPLIVEHEIIYAPSASILAMMRRGGAGHKPADKIVAVIADPVFNKNDSRVKPANDGTVSSAGRLNIPADLERALRDSGLAGGDSGLLPLPFTRREAESILSFAPAEKSLKALGLKASRATTSGDELSRYRIVHFATHALINDEHPELSGIVLSLVNEQAESQEGFLRLHDIYGLKLRADLVVLSACRTALGKDIRGEGFVGLTSGVMFAGAERVVASLWNVDEVATAELMKYFYKGMLVKGLRPAAALREAQLEIWKRSQWRFPYYWAAFTLQGKWN